MAWLQGPAVPIPFGFFARAASAFDGRRDGHADAHGAATTGTKWIAREAHTCIDRCHGELLRTLVELRETRRHWQQALSEVEDAKRRAELTFLTRSAITKPSATDLSSRHPTEAHLDAGQVMLRNQRDHDTKVARVDADVHSAQQRQTLARTQVEDLAAQIRLADEALKTRAAQIWEHHNRRVEHYRRAYTRALTRRVPVDTELIDHAVITHRPIHRPDWLDQPCQWLDAVDLSKGGRD